MIMICMLILKLKNKYYFYIFLYTSKKQYTQLYQSRTNVRM